MKYNAKSIFISVLLFALAFCFVSTVKAQKTKKNIRQNSGAINNIRVAEIPFEMSDDGHIFLRVRANNSEPLLFGLDSGFEQSAITTKQAKALNLNLYGETQVTGGVKD